MPSATASAAAASLTTTTVAAFFIPAAWPLAGLMVANQCDPEAIFKAGMDWLTIYDELGYAQDQAENTTISKDEWKGKDRDGYDERIEEYQAHLTGSKSLAMAVGASTTLIAGLSFLVVVLMVFMAVVMALLLIYLAVAAWTPIFGQTAVLGQCNAIAAEFATFLGTVSGLVAKVAAGAAGVVAAAMAFDFTWQKMHGNESIDNDFGQGIIDASDNMLFGTLARLERTVTQVGVGMGIPTVSPFLGGMGSGGAWTGGNLTDHITGAFGDPINSQEGGLYEDPPKK